MQRPSTSLILAGATLLVGASVAFAGDVMIPSNSIKGSQIINGTLTPSDLAPSADPSVAYFGFRGAELALPVAPTDVVKVNVPAGRYVLQAGVDVEVPNGADALMSCKLQDGDEPDARALDFAWDSRRTPATLPAAGQRVSITMTGVTNGPTGAGNFVVRCQSSFPGAKVVDARITATLVRGLTITQNG